MKITQKISIAITNINHLIDNTKDIINGLPPGNNILRKS